MRHSFRSATSGDYEFVRSLHHETLREYIEPLQGWDEARQNGFVEKWFKPECTKIIQAESRAGAPGGTEDIGILIFEAREKDFLLETLSLKPCYQGQGIGTAILRDLTHLAHEKRMGIVLQVLKNNPAKRLYERMGFRVEGSCKTHWVMRCPASHLSGELASHPDAR